MAPLMRLDMIAQPITSVDEFAITEDDIIVDPASGLPMASWSNLGTVVNKIDAQYDFNETDHPLDFSKRQIWDAVASIDRYSAQPPLSIELRGVHTDAGGQEILDRFALLYLQRWGYPPPILTLSITYRRHLFEALDTVRVTHAKIHNPISGVLGLDAERMEIISLTPRWATPGGGMLGRLELMLIWIGAIESSAVPVSRGTLSLVPGESTIDATDTNIPFASSITLTTPGDPCTAFRIGLKALNYRVWRCFFDDTAFTVHGKDIEPTCDTYAGNFYSSNVYNTTCTYHLEYKVDSAPDAPGGGNPAMGWVELLPSADRGNTSFFTAADCNASPGVPAEDTWAHYFSSILGAGEGSRLLSAPAVYNVNIFFDSVTTQGDPCPISHSNCAGLGIGCLSTYTGSLLQTDQIRMTGDYIESIV
jgi:hypothetical protein